MKGFQHRKHKASLCFEEEESRGEKHWSTSIITSDTETRSTAQELSTICYNSHTEVHFWNQFNFHICSGQHPSPERDTDTSTQHCIKKHSGAASQVGVDSQVLFKEITLQESELRQDSHIFTCSSSKPCHSVMCLTFLPEFAFLYTSTASQIAVAYISHSNHFQHPQGEACTKTLDYNLVGVRY